MEIAVTQDNFEVLIILTGFAEVSATMKLDFLRMILENQKGGEKYAEEFKKNLEGLSGSKVGDNIADQLPPCVCFQVLEKQLQCPWHLTSTLDDSILVNMIQFAAAKGNTEILQLLLDHGYSLIYSRSLLFHYHQAKVKTKRLYSSFVIELACADWTLRPTRRTLRQHLNLQQ